MALQTEKNGVSPAAADGLNPLISLVPGTRIELVQRLSSEGF